MEPEKISKFEKYANLYNKDAFNTLNEEMSFEEYVERLYQRPRLCRNSFQYILDMILAPGTEEFERYRTTYVKYKFFSEDKISPIFGLEETLDALVNFIHGAAGGFGTEKRVCLLHGPVGSSKSTICRIIKRGLESYSKTDDGAWYTYRWVNLPTEGDKFVYTNPTDECPMHQDPIKLMPMEMRLKLIKDLNLILKQQIEDEKAGLKEGEKYNKGIYELECKGGLNPRCRLFMNMLLKQHNGDWGQVVKNHIRVVRKCHSEIDRIGIGTFQPKDAKNQDSTELTGDMNFGKIGQFGADSDPRAFNFDGEFEVAERGVLEFIEALKLDNEFLYDLLGATQEHQVKPKKFSQVEIDEFILAHTNAPEFEKLKNDKFMEALRDRMVKIDVPYLLRWSDEIKVLEHDYGPGKIKQHLMPHTLEIVALFGVLTRLRRADDEKLDLRTKAKLYDGKTIPNWTEDSVKELKDKYSDEGIQGGLSARYIQDKLSNCLARNTEYVNAFIVLNELREGLDNSSLITNPEEREYYKYCIELTSKELDEILKAEVQKALVANEDVMVRLCAKYIDNMIAYINGEKIINPITKKPADPDETLMRSIEEKIKIPDQGSRDFRRSIATFMTTLSHRNQTFDWKSNPELRRALERKVYEDTKDHIKITTLSSDSNCVDPDLQDKIDAIKTRLIEQYGYNRQSAEDVLNYVSGIFSRGDVDDND